jgi:enoyl-CoA hydratase
VLDLSTAGQKDDLFLLEDLGDAALLRLASADGSNRLTRRRVQALTGCLASLPPKPLIIAGNARFFSAGADLNEIASLTGPEAYEFARMGQALMERVSRFSAPVVAAVSGYCMGGGLDLGLACHARIAAPNAIFGHRGAALGIMTGWGGTQRLPRLIGKAAAMQMFAAADKLHAQQALQIGLVDAVAEDPIAAARAMLHRMTAAPSAIL